VDPVWPYDLLLEGKGGSAAVEFTVNPNGEVVNVSVREATHPELGEALAISMEGWRFDPALRDGRGVEARLVRRVEFPAVSLEAANAGDPLTRVVGLARAGSIRGGTGIDGRLTPLYRPPPMLPPVASGESKPTGEVKIEFVIDRDGRVRLPRIVAASDPKLGWSAATAVAQWVFKAPTRGGEPTEVKVQMPMKF
jgi:TonB family protein